MSRVFGGVSTDKVDVTVYSAINDLMTMTYAAWTYRTGDGGGNLGRMIDNGGGGAGHQGQALLNRASTTTYVWVASRWSGANAEWTMPRPGANAWHHIAVTYDYGSTSNIPVMYIDAASQTVTTTIGASGTVSSQDETHCFIGNRPSDSARVWAGSLAEVAIWNRVLSASEVAGIYAWGPLAHPSGLVLYVPLIGGASPEPNYYNGAGNGTVTGATVGDHPPIRSMMLGRPRRAVKAAAVSTAALYDPSVRNPYYNTLLRM